VCSCLEGSSAWVRFLDTCSSPFDKRLTIGGKRRRKKKSVLSKNMTWEKTVCKETGKVGKKVLSLFFLSEVRRPNKIQT